MLDTSLTLREVADNLYFPARLTIQAKDTISQYHLAFSFYDRFLCRESQVSNLNDLEVTKFKRWLHHDRQLAAKTVNERAGRIIAMWNWLARKRLVDAFPCVEKIPEPKRAPRAWTIDQLQLIFREFLSCRGRICGIPTSLWLRGLCGFLWNTSERIGATLKCDWSMLDTSRGSILVPAEIRKRGQSDEVYMLWPEVLAILDEIRKYGNHLIFPTDFEKSALYHRYKKVLKRANLPHGRSNMFHCMRVSHATWTQALGGNATQALRHANAATTKRHYIDGSIVNQQQSVLPRDFI
jgi:integrase